ncbi:hypothetical protein M9H77_21308 [Catharanthus roseus]|uniref:Uncharacterized protein n=1 Tax=Catharanthus roseus TaxID=4058 RepID=A0ACC0AP08_CATRO|nr:hypothetical protein M9H77_21308 [Catharanthus roseus]
MSKEAAKQQEEANIIASTISVIAISYMKYTTYQFKICVPVYWEDFYWYCFIVNMTKQKILLVDSQRSIELIPRKKALVNSLRIGIHEALKAGLKKRYKLEIDKFPIDDSVMLSRIEEV